MGKGLHRWGRGAWVSVWLSVRGLLSPGTYASGWEVGKGRRKGPDAISLGHFDAEGREWEAGLPGN